LHDPDIQRMLEQRRCMPSQRQEKDYSMHCRQILFPSPQVIFMGIAQEVAFAELNAAVADRIGGREVK
jgi:hypothetical protein